MLKYLVGLFFHQAYQTGIPSERYVHYVFRFRIEENLDWHDAITSGLEVTTMAEAKNGS